MNPEYTGNRKYTYISNSLFNEILGDIYLKGWHTLKWKIDNYNESFDPRYKKYKSTIIEIFQCCMLLAKSYEEQNKMAREKPIFRLHHEIGLSPDRIVSIINELGGVPMSPSEILKMSENQFFKREPPQWIKNAMEIKK